MLGQLVFDGGRGGPRRALLYGLPVLRCHTDPEGFWGERRLKKAGRSLCTGGAVRALVPPGFDRWPLLLALGLRPMDPGPFLRAHAAPLTASLLERQGLAPDRATVALRGQRADGAMLRADHLRPPGRGAAGGLAAAGIWPAHFTGGCPSSGSPFASAGSGAGRCGRFRPLPRPHPVRPRP